MHYKNLAKYLDSTYLKTAAEANITSKKDKDIVQNIIKEAIEFNFKLVMIRSNHISLAKKIIKEKNSLVKIGTVIDFPLGLASTEDKIKEANYAFKKNVDEIDVVIDYNAFKKGDFKKVINDILKITKIAMNNNKVIKWIIETAALSNIQIKEISKLLTSTVTKNFNKPENVFIKTSTGYYKNIEKPNGATIENIKIIKDNAGKLKIKASGGISNAQSTQKMINAGASRIGTSSAKNIILGINKKSNY